MIINYYITILLLLLGLAFLFLPKRQRIGKVILGIGILFLISFETQKSFENYIVAYNAYLYYLPDPHAYHWLKKFLQLFFEPVPIVIYAIGISYIFVLLKKKSIVGRIALACGTILFILFGYSWFGCFIAYPLNNVYPQYKKDKNPVEYVAVLNGPSHKYCFPEGIRLCKNNEHSKLIVSAYNENGKIKSILGEQAKTAGIIREDIIYNVGPTDTYMEIVGISHIVKETPFVLVTDALQMRRAMILSKRLGAKPIPAPIRSADPDNGKIESLKWLPTIDNFNVIRATFHEYLSILWIYFDFF